MYLQNNNKDTAASLDQHLFPSRTRSRDCRVVGLELRCSAWEEKTWTIVDGSWKTMVGRTLVWRSAGIPGRQRLDRATLHANHASPRFWKVTTVTFEHDHFAYHSFVRYEQLRNAPDPSVCADAGIRSRVCSDVKARVSW